MYERTRDGSGQPRSTRVKPAATPKTAGEVRNLSRSRGEGCCDSPAQRMTDSPTTCVNIVLTRQLIAHGIADEHGVGHAAHDDEHAERAARQPQEPPEQEGEQVIEGNATERNEQVAPVFRQHFARQPRGQAVNAHTGNGDGHNESAEKGLGVRTDPTSDRADIASGSQQQDDRDRGD